MLTRLDGVCPATFVQYTDATCLTIDEEATLAHYRFLAGHQLGALVVGGHAGEVPALTIEEQAQLIELAREASNDRIPVVAGVVADSTLEAIRVGLVVRDAGAAAVMITPPAIPGWNGQTDAHYYSKHLGAFEEHVGLPIVLIGAPAPEFGTSYFLPPPALKEIVSGVESIIAVKITASWNLGAFRRAQEVIKGVRDISCLQAGAQNTFGAFLYGADGNLSGATNFRPGDDVEILRAVRAGELEHARSLSDSWNEVTDILYGMQRGLPVVPFHYRYKIVAWLMGIIERPHMRLPQLPPPVTDIELLRDALVRAGKPVAREAHAVEAATVRPEAVAGVES